MAEECVLSVSSPFSPNNFGQIAAVFALPEFRIERCDAELWAIRDCKFLISDEIQDRASSVKCSASSNSTFHGGHRDHGTLDGGNSESHDAHVEGNESSAREKGKQAKSQSEGDSEDDSDGETTMRVFGHRGPRYGLAPNVSHYDDDQDFECIICSKCPEFPNDKKTRKFRLFRPRNEFPELFKNAIPMVDNICTHYLAVSYCWPPQQKDDQGNLVEVPRTYEVRDLDGTVRKNRALDDVLDRAVDVANNFGLRMIWIDQECLPQPPQDNVSPEKEDKEMGIQAMDMIYNRAFVAGGLQDVVISNQRELDTIRGFASASNKPTHKREIMSFQEFDLILGFLKRVGTDLWYTRAWVVQEAISAGDNLSLVFRRDAGVSVRPKPRMPRVRRGLPRHSLEESGRRLQSDVVCLMMHEFRYIVQAATVFFQENSIVKLHGDFSIYRDGVLRPAGPILRAAEALHPEFLKPKHELFSLGVVGGTSFGVRPTIDAAGALTLLLKRKCYHEEDLIAIMANTCGYEHRISPKLVAAKRCPLRVAFLALALMNGDYSLLVPEAYSRTLAADAADNPSFKLLQRFRPGWVHPFDIDLPFLDQVTIRGFDLPRTSYRDGRPGVIGLPAYLWEVSSEPIDLTPIKLQWSQDWFGLLCVLLEVSQQMEEDEAEATRRREAIIQRFHTSRAYPYLKQELARNGFISNDSAFWRGIEKYAGTAKFRLVLVAERLEASSKYQKIFADMFFGILRFLFSQADSDSRAQGVANSIWQSIRVDAVAGDHPELPDYVCEDLFQHSAVRQVPFQTIQLDKTRDGEFHQFWLIDRIMRHGNLYVGSYLPEPKIGKLSENEALGLAVGISKNQTEPGAQEGSKNILGSKRSHDDTGNANDGIMQRQWKRHVGAHAFAYHYMKRTFRYEPDAQKRTRSRAVDALLTPGTMLSVLEGSSKVNDTEGEVRRSKELFSVFDVEGPCTIAIPYDRAWEMIPHPSLRSMSVCWVVEVGGAPDTGQEIFTQMTGDTLPKPRIDEEYEVTPSIRVLDKVRGCWSIMQDRPIEGYTLIDTGI